ncbi:hypothetical protein [Sorangium sp. So ce1335]|uniref:hypothetical protein n=1 Tax=Sorangium sp. So ce1335 TaxID=3133335 RepID=UPI003F60074E
MKGARRSGAEPAAPPLAVRDPYRSGGQGGPLDRYRQVLDRLPLPAARTAAGAHLPVRLLHDTDPVGPVSHRAQVAIFIAAFSLWGLAVSLERPGRTSVLAALVFALSAWMAWWFLVGHLRRASRDLSIELAEEPLVLGAPLRVCLALRGPRRVRRVRVTLVCEERVQFQHGSDTASDAHRLWERVLLLVEGLDIERARGWYQEVMAHLPEQATHSFKSASNEIRWAFLVDIQAERGSRVTLSYPVRVLPPA